MSQTQTLTFNFPLSPKPNAGNAQSVLQGANGWTLTVRNGGTDRLITVSKKSVRVSLNAGHYSAFCSAFQANSGSKNVSVTYTSSSVESVRWDTTTVSLPDGASLTARTALHDEPEGGTGGSDADNSSKVA